MSQACRIAALLLAARGSDAWISYTQARYGSSIGEIQAQQHGNGFQASTYSYRWLSHLWNLPENTFTDDGLGGSITYAWDPALCGALQPLFKEDLFFTNMINCVDFKTALHRAFETWSSHHKVCTTRAWRWATR